MNVYLLTLLVVLLMVTIACEDKDTKCLEAAWIVNHDNPDWDEWEKATDYFRANCTWDGDRPVGR